MNFYAFLLKFMQQIKSQIKSKLTLSLVPNTIFIRVNIMRKKKILKLIYNFIVFQIINFKKFSLF